MQAVVRIDPFTVNQTVFISEKKQFSGFRKVNTDLSELSNFLMSLEGLTEIHLFGQPDYIKKIIEPIETKYSNINIYINK